MTIGSDFTRTLAAAKSGAEWAWADIYRDLAGHVTAYLAARGSTEPEDLTSEVFLQAARDIASFHGDESGFRSWLFVIAHRRLIDSWRAAGRRPRPLVTLDGLADPPGGDAEEEALEQLRTSELLSAFQRLTEDQRAVLALRLIGGLTLAETAEALGKREGAVKALQRRALLALENILDDLE
jgi:RNA polymerase sigma factor (sigma-70 family)